ncbi:MAG TPA: 50S ribosomal protein L35 [Elusimicrobiota bacterium]|jgi:large subunit ribosomal protein L35|nr:50S ribosomal protein L35 [Elusimicrobiota bacterium]
MPKIKSHSGAKKRFKRTASGKWKYKRAATRHLLTPSSAKHARSHRKSRTLTATEGEILRKYLPYN